LEAVVYILITCGVASVALLIFGIIAHHRTKKKMPGITDMPRHYRDVLENDVPFYQKLSFEKKREFEKRMMHFLGTTHLTGIGTVVEDIDKVYIAASAIIPIFAFPKWEYFNLKEILLYPDSFDHDFAQTGYGRNILGMVGDGPYNNTMILSQHQLRQAFINKTGKENTAIHEFVHLLDKSDGSVDGIPENFVDRKYAVPWLELIRKEINKIYEDNSDIDSYGATNEAEFFAVASEYFFERPELLEEKHPELYKALVKIFQHEPS
jgi:Mlc titration factor MtfA (ptsG expression regulator)